MSKQPLPPFGAYVQVPLWFKNYCVPVVGPTAACVWEHLWSKCRWKESKFDVKIPVEVIAKAVGISASTANIALTALSANDLLAICKGKSARDPKTYTVPMYTVEEAALRFKNKTNSVHRKSVDKSLPIFSERKPIFFTENR